MEFSSDLSSVDFKEYIFFLYVDKQKQEVPNKYFERLNLVELIYAISEFHHFKCIAGNFARLLICLPVQFVEMVDGVHCDFATLFILQYAIYL